MSLAADCKTQLYKRHVLADSGINLIHQQTIAVERFAVLDFRWSLPNARLQVLTWASSSFGMRYHDQCVDVLDWVRCYDYCQPFCPRISA
jgi:hypothetical protein